MTIKLNLKKDKKIDSQVQLKFSATFKILFLNQKKMPFCQSRRNVANDINDY
jgi:hypothetical protein